MPLVKRGNSRFWYVQFQLNHRTFVRSTRTTDRKIAEKLEAKYKAEAHADGVLGKKRMISLADALARFIDTKEGTPNQKNLLQHRKAVLGCLIGSLPIASLTNDDLERYKRTRAGQGRA